MKNTLLVIAVAAVAFAGCISDEARPNSVETKQMVADAVEGLETYSFNIEMDQKAQFRNLSGEGSLEGETILLDWKGEVNLVEGRVKETTTTTRKSLTGDQKFNQTMESYLLNDTTYQKVGENWIRMTVPEPGYGLDKANQASHLIEIIDRSDIVFEKSEKVGGVNTYRFKLIPDDDTTYGIMVGQISSVDPRLLLMINLTELFEGGREMEWTIWIAKETYLPMKSEIRTTYTATSDTLNLPEGSAENLKIQFETREARHFYNYGKPLKIELPEEAIDAQFLFPTSFDQTPIHVNAGSLS